MKQKKMSQRQVKQFVEKVNAADGIYDARKYRYWTFDNVLFRAPIALLGKPRIVAFVEAWKIQ